MIEVKKGRLKSGGQVWVSAWRPVHLSPYDSWDWLQHTSCLINRWLEVWSCPPPGGPRLRGRRQSGTRERVISVWDKKYPLLCILPLLQCLLCSIIFSISWATYLRTPPYLCLLIGTSLPPFVDQIHCTQTKLLFLIFLIILTLSATVATRVHSYAQSGSHLPPSLPFN